MVKNKLDFNSRPLSYSSISSFEWNKDKWYRSYILGEQQSSLEMTFGSMIDKKIENDPTFLPTLPRYSIMQHKMKAMFNGIQIIGTADGMCFDKFLLADFKTGRIPWDQKRTDETKQLTMYLLLAYITKKVSPEDFKCYIHWLPTKKDDHGNFESEISFRDDPVVPITFETKRSMKDILLFGSYIMKTVDEMKSFVESHA